jgi:hypothetical protein
VEPMLDRAFNTLARLRVTLGYAVTLVVVAATLVLRGPHVQDLVVRHMSTNLHNLERGRIATLIGSAFVTSSGPIWAWLPGLVCLLALAELLWRSRCVLVTFTLGHVGATLIVAAGVAASIELGWLPTSVTHATDVGISYGAAAVLGGLTAAIPARWRPAWVGWWVSVALIVVCIGDDFTDGGHFVALILGILLSLRFGTVATWTRARVALLVASVAFGYMVMVNTEASLTVAPVVGASGALLAHWLGLRLPRRAVPSPPAAEPVMAVPEPSYRL